jgi:mevalonate kinase
MDQRYRTRAPRNQLPEEEVVGLVQAALLHLQSSQQSITLKQISDLVGLSLHRLRLYPEVKAILDRIAEERRLQRKQQAILHEQSLAEQVRKAIQQLHDQGQPVSRQAVGELVGLAPRALAKYHLLRPLLSQIVEEYRSATGDTAITGAGSANHTKSSEPTAWSHRAGAHVLPEIQKGLS